MNTLKTLMNQNSVQTPKTRSIFDNLASQLNVNDLIGHTYTWCNYFNYVNAYFFCLPWFIFLGE